MPSIASFGASVRFFAVVFACALGLAPATTTPAFAQEADRNRDRLVPESDRIVRGLGFEGNRAIPDATLANAINTTNSSWFARVVPFRWLGLGEKRYFSEQDFRYDYQALKIFYKAAGYPDVQIDTAVRRTRENAYITFRIREGEPIRVTSLQVHWLDSLRPVPAWLRRLALRDLPLEQGDVFSRFAMSADADSIEHRLQDRGYPGARVLPGYDWNKVAHTAAVTFDVEPGTYAVISSVRVDGANRVDSALIPRLMVAHPGRRFSTGEMFDSQRNLYRSELFRYVSIGIDSATYRSGPSDSVPLHVQVAENPPRRIRGSLGFATSDCFRGSLGWAKRNFIGSGRVLDLSSRVSKVGVGDPLDWGLADGICGALAEDTIGSANVNYGLTAAVRQPGFLSPYNSLALSLYTELRSEFKVYLRRETGVSLAFAREGARRRIPLSLVYTLSYGRTEATAANFCAFFNACTPAVLSSLQQNRVLGTLIGKATIPRVNNPFDPARGSVKSLEVTLSSRFIGSSSLQQFTRIVADAAWYRSLSRDVVLSWRLRGGVIFAPRLDVGDQSAAFIPPEHRFYAGGPNDVRGFERNELGPVVYVVPKTYVDSVGAAHIEADSVRVAATGGNSLGIGNVELRVPSPVFGSRVRLAAFVDAGTLWQRQAAVSTPPLLRVTPGFGLRVVTPLGPARLDFAYNSYSLQEGALFQVDNETGALDSVSGRESYVINRRGRLTIHFAVGQPF